MPRGGLRPGGARAQHLHRGVPPRRGRPFRPGPQCAPGAWDGAGPVFGYGIAAFGAGPLAAVQEPIRSTIPARLDRLGWSSFHTRMVFGLSAAWILDGLQITIASSVTGMLSSPQTLDMTSTEIGLIASVYLVGEIIGALVFGRLSDQLGLRRLLMVTLLLYLLGTGGRRPHHRASPWLAALLLRDAAGGGHGHRRPVRGDQLRDRRDDAVQVPASGSTAPTGLARSSARSPPSSFSTCSRSTSAGGWRS